MNGGTCFIFGAGVRCGPPPMPGPGDFVIAADGGYRYVLAQKLQADLLVGDFDSLEDPPAHLATLRLPQEKDDTDMAAALKAGWERGYRTFRIYGGTGGRPDHTLANIQCLAGLARRGGRGFLYDRYCVITAVHNGSASFPAGAQGTISVFAHTDTAAGVWESGLKYSLSGATLANTYPLGVSNEFTGVASRICVESGTLMLMYPHAVRETGG